MQAAKVLTPAQAIAAYRDDILLTHPDDGRVIVTPTLFATVFFEGGGRPEVRQALLACFDAFESRFAGQLKGGILWRNGGGKYTAKTEKGVQAMRQEILEAAPSKAVQFVRSSVTDQYTAPAYLFKCLTSTLFPQGDDGGMLSYMKFVLPWELATSSTGLAVYEDYLRLVCQTLPVRGGYGGLTATLPTDYDRYMPQEWALAKRFSGLEMDSTPFWEAHTYRMQSVENEDTPNEALYSYLKPGAKVLGIGHIKGVNWYTILGDVFVERLGGEAALRQQLQREDIGVERQGQCVLLRAGVFPRLGAPEEGVIEPYAWVNRVVRSLRDPAHDALHSYIPDTERADVDNTRRWLARFDRAEDGPVVPWSPLHTPSKLAPAVGEVPAAHPGQACPQAGLWFAPNLRNREVRMALGEPMPGVGEVGAIGEVIWYWRAG